MKPINTISHRPVTLPALAFLVLFLAGCGSGPSTHVETEHDHDEQDQHAEHASSESTYVEGKGVQLSQPGQASLGVRMEEVRIEQVQPEISLQAQIYRQANESPRSNSPTRPGFAYASVFHDTDGGTGLEMGAEGTAQIGTETLPARLIEIDRQLVDSMNQVEYLIEVRDPENQLELGDFVRVTFSSEKADGERLVVVPETAVLRTARGDFAFAENQGFLFRTPIKVIRIQNDRALITEGLYEGDRIAANQVENLYLIELQVTNGGKGCAHGH